MTSSDGPLVSIIITAREEEKYLEKTLQALKAQTYKNIEIIVTDSCSTDKTVEIAKKYADRVEIKDTKISQGKNLGASFARGEFLLFVNADVRLDKDWITNALETHQKYQPSLVMGRIEPLEKTWKSKLFSSICMNIVRVAYRCGFPRTMGECTFLVEKDLHFKIGGFPENMSCFEDLKYGSMVREFSRKRSPSQYEPIKLEERCIGYASFRRYESDSLYWPLWGLVREAVLKLTRKTPKEYPLVRR